MWDATEAAQLAAVKHKSRKRAERAAPSFGAPMRPDVDSGQDETRDPSPALSRTSEWSGRDPSELSSAPRCRLTVIILTVGDRVELHSPSRFHHIMNAGNGQSMAPLCQIHRVNGWSRAPCHVGRETHHRLSIPPRRPLHRVEGPGTYHRSSSAPCRHHCLVEKRGWTTGLHLLLGRTLVLTSWVISLFHQIIASNTPQESLLDYDEEGLLDDAIGYYQFPKGFSGSSPEPDADELLGSALRSSTHPSHKVHSQDETSVRFRDHREEADLMTLPLVRTSPIPGQAVRDRLHPLICRAVVFCFTDERGTFLRCCLPLPQRWSGACRALRFCNPEQYTRMRTDGISSFWTILLNNGLHGFRSGASLLLPWLLLGSRPQNLVSP